MHTGLIENSRLSNRAKHALLREGYEIVADILDLTEEKLYEMDNLGRKTVCEILEFIELVRPCNGVDPNKQYNVDEPKIIAISDNISQPIKDLLVTEEGKQLLLQFFNAKQISTKTVNFSNRTFNALARNGIFNFGELFPLYPNGFYSISNLGAKSIAEIFQTIEKCLLFFSGDIERIVNGDCSIAQLSKKKLIKDFSIYSIEDLLTDDIFFDCLERYIENNDLMIEEANFGSKARNYLSSEGVRFLSEALIIAKEASLSNITLTQKTKEDLLERIKDYIENNKERILDYYAGNASALYSDDSIKNQIIELFDLEPFRGISYKVVRQSISDDIENERLMRIIGELLQAKQFLYIEYKLYRVYPSAFEVLAKMKTGLDEIHYEILLKRFRGESLESIGVEYSKTREAIRLIFLKTWSKVKDWAVANDIKTFDEEYYTYLYENYDISIEFWQDTLNLPETAYLYLKALYKRGKRALDEAVNDDKIALGLRVRIRDFLQREYLKDKILLDGKYVVNDRMSVEDFIIKNYCKDEIAFNDFMVLYNEVLLRNNQGANEEIYYESRMAKTRISRIMQAPICLWKEGETFRYYDITSYDYDELISTLNLSDRHDTVISTLKFYNDYPWLMEKYDIHDQYELHNLLRKIIQPEKVPELQFGRQPTLIFGRGNREEIILELIRANSPITVNDLSNLLYEEYGFDKGVLCYKTISQYLYQGVYSLDNKYVPEDKVAILKAALTLDFYYIAEIKEIYCFLFPNADKEEINPYSLKKMGFVVLSDYAVQHWGSSTEYFYNLFMQKDIYDISDFSRRYGNITLYNQIYHEFRKKYNIFIFDKNQIVTFSRLEKMGITKNDIYDFCDAVAKMVDKNELFNFHYLKELGYSFDLEKLGFDDSFYNNILAMSNLFTYQRFFNDIILQIKTDNHVIANKKDVILFLLSKYEKVEIEDFINDIKNEYGIIVSDRYYIYEAIESTDFYYDNIMDTIYKNKEVYYSEFDE